MSSSPITPSRSSRAETNDTTVCDHHRGLFGNQAIGRAGDEASRSVPSLAFRSRGLTVARMTMTLLRTSNQNGAPSITTNAVINQPMMVCSHIPTDNEHAAVPLLARH